MSFTEEWDYTEEKHRTRETISDKKRIYLHFYYNDQKTTDDKNRFTAILDRLEYNLVNGTPDPAAEKLYQKYFTKISHLSEESLQPQRGCYPQRGE